MKVLILFTICLSVTTVTAAPAAPKGFDHQMTVVADEYFLYWTVKGDEITFQVQVKTLGYVGFGISPNGGMAGADIVTAWVKDDTVYFQDRHANRNAMPETDVEQNWSVIEGHEVDGFTIVTFKRPLISCDKANDRDITGETMRLIYAYHPEDPKDAESITYHGSTRRGTKSATLLIYGVQKTISEVPPHTAHHDFLIDISEVPAKNTSYWCTALKMPDLKEKHHVVRIEPVITKGNEGIVHHIVLYACTHEFDEPAHVGKSEDCYANLMGEVDKCNAFLAGWAIGGPALNFPDHVGYPIGGGLTPTMVKVEIHYDNPSSKAGIKDKSGFRMYYTSELREFDAGYVETGSIVNGLVIPPKFNRIISRSFCPGKCLSQVIPEDEDIKVFAVFLHAHLLSTKIDLRHFRDGKELPPIAKDDYYDFNYQDIRILPKEVIVKPTDDLVIECHFRSEDIKNTTYGGLSTVDEMCFVFVSYYPKRALSRCLTGADDSQFFKIVNSPHVSIDDKILKKYNMTAPTRKETKEMMELVDWNNELVRENYQNLLMEDDVPLRLVCDDGMEMNAFPEHDTHVITPRINVTYKAPTPVCYKASSGSMVTASSFVVLLFLHLMIIL